MPTFRIKFDWLFKGPLYLLLFFGHTFFVPLTVHQLKRGMKFCSKVLVQKLKTYVSNYFIINTGIINFKYCVIITLYFLFLEFLSTYS